MKHIYWKVGSLTLPMIKLEDGTLLMLIQTAAGALECPVSTVRNLIADLSLHLSKICVGNPDAISFLKVNREIFGLKYIRSDMRLLTESDFLILVAHARGTRATQLHREFIDLIRAQAIENCVTREEYIALQTQLMQLASRFENMEQEVRAADPFVSKTASLAGSLLSAQRGTKGIRTLN